MVINAPITLGKYGETGGDSPVLHFDPVEGVWIGGMFWDGRATGFAAG
jgi:hypothetical protein